MKYKKIRFYYNQGIQETEFRIQNEATSEKLSGFDRMAESGIKQTMHSTGFHTLKEWNDKAHQFVLAVYRLTESFPRTEIYGLSSQLRRSAVSIAANIAEGFKKRGNADKARFLNIAQGSLEESRYYLILAQDLEYGTNAELQAILSEVSKLLETYCKAILNSGS